MLKTIFFLLLLGVIVINFKRLTITSSSLEKGMNRFDKTHLTFVKSLSTYTSKLPKLTYLFSVVVSVFIAVVVFSVVSAQYKLSDADQLFIVIPVLIAFISFIPSVALKLVLWIFGKPPLSL